MKKLMIVALASAAGSSAALGQTWAESGDAGDLPGTAQSIVGAGALTNITGSVSVTSDADIYMIYISNPAAFSATTNIAPGTMTDTTLYLFNLDGTGIAKNDDMSGTNFLSNLPVGAAQYSSLTPGYYLLAIAGFAFAPYSVSPPASISDLTFDVNAFTGVQSAQLPGPMLGWANAGMYDSGTYNITLTGAMVPTPGAAAALGLAGVVGLRRRR